MLHEACNFMAALQEFASSLFLGQEQRPLLAQALVPVLLAAVKVRCCHASSSLPALFLDNSP